MNFSYNSLLQYHLMKPQAIAIVGGSYDYSDIRGIVLFFQFKEGIIIETKIEGLKSNDNLCSNNFHAMHIHTGSDCKKDENTSFINVKKHYNPDNCNHPGHRGDLVPLVANKSISYSKILYDKLTLNELIDKLIIIHESFDDFMTQPSGNAGKMIACGEIKRI